MSYYFRSRSGSEDEYSEDLSLDTAQTKYLQLRRCLDKYKCAWIHRNTIKLVCRSDRLYPNMEELRDSVQKHFGEEAIVGYAIIQAHCMEEDIAPTRHLYFRYMKEFINAIPSIEKLLQNSQCSDLNASEKTIERIVKQHCDNVLPTLKDIMDKIDEKWANGSLLKTNTENTRSVVFIQYPKPFYSNLGWELKHDTSLHLMYKSSDYIHGAKKKHNYEQTVKAAVLASKLVFLYMMKIIYSFPWGGEFWFFPCLKFNTSMQLKYHCKLGTLDWLKKYEKPPNPNGDDDDDTTRYVYASKFMETNYEAKDQDSNPLFGSTLINNQRKSLRLLSKNNNEKKAMDYTNAIYNEYIDESEPLVDQSRRFINAKGRLGGLNVHQDTVLDKYINSLHTQRHQHDNTCLKSLMVKKNSDNVNANNNNNTNMNDNSCENISVNGSESNGSESSNDSDESRSEVPDTPPRKIVN